MAKGQLFIRFWILDDDTGRKKTGSPWFDFDFERSDIDLWLDENTFGHRWVEETFYKYRKENKK